MGSIDVIHGAALADTKEADQVDWVGGVAGFIQFTDRREPQMASDLR